MVERYNIFWCRGQDLTRNILTFSKGVLTLCIEVEPFNSEIEPQSFELSFKKTLNLLKTALFTRLY